MFSLKPLLASLIILSVMLGHTPALSQEGKSDNAPIYLEEPAPEPAARVARRKVLKETYEDKSPRDERSVAQLSDDRIVNDGKYVEYYRGGQKYVEGTYKMGVFEGGWSYWFPNGQLRKTVTFKDGKPEGQWEEYNEEGTRIAKKSYLAGKRHGQWITYFADGTQPKFEMNYQNGLAFGERLTYFPNGQKRQSIVFKDGKMDGPMIEWNSSGKKTAKATFKAGKITGEIERFSVE